MHKQACLALIGSFLLLSAPAFARGKAAKAAASDRETRDRDAHKACLEGDYAKGVSILSDLFLDSRDPTYIFNQGRCYEQNERYQEAVGRFREYIRTPGNTDAALAQKHISECEQLDAKKKPPLVAPVVYPARQPMLQPQPTPRIAQPLHEPSTSSSSGSGLLTTGIIIGGVGVASLVTGLILNLKANSLANEIEPPNPYDSSKESTRRGYETFSWVGYGVGAAALVTGVVLYGVGLSKSHTHDITFVPALGPGLASAALRGAF